jgi:uncharacterized protein YbaP (TraB family)
MWTTAINKIVFLFLLIFGITFQSTAQRSVLIKYAPEGATQPSYILAILEHAQSFNYPLDNIAKNVVEEVNTVAFEWLPETYELEKAGSIMSLKGDENLKRYYKRDDNIRYELFIIDNLGEEVEEYQMYTPLYTMNLFRAYFEGEGRGYHNKQIFKAAQEQIKPVLSMLNIQIIADALFNLSFEAQADILSSYVNTFENYQNLERSKLQQYGSQNIDGIARIEREQEHPEYISSYQNVLNIILADKMLQLANQQSVLFVINVDRLGGSGGVLELLENKGGVLEPMEVSIQQAVEDLDGIDDFYTEDTNVLEDEDGFPEYLLNSGVVIKNNKEIVVAKEKLVGNDAGFIAVQDPYGDQYDYLAADTSFLNEWYELRSNDAFFSIMMPEKAIWESSTTNSINGPIKTITSSTNHARSDLFYSIGYTIYPPNFDPEFRAPFFDDFVYRSARKWKGELLDQRIISHPEYTGRAFVVAVNDSFFVRSSLVLKGNVLYQVLCGGPGDKPYSAYAEEFFRSFKLDAGKSGNWFLHEDASFTCYFPRPPLIDNQSINTQYGPLRITTLNADDFENGLSYFVSSNIYPPGYKLKKESAFYKDLIADAERQYFGRVIREEKIKKGKLSGREVILNLNDGKVYRIHFFIDNNAVYQCLVGGSSADVMSANAEYFLQQFTFR